MCWSHPRKGNNMNAKEEMTKLLMESYDRGVEDVKQEAIVALEKTVAVMVAAEREACAKIAETTVCDVHLPTGTKIYGSRVATAIRARGTT